MHVYTFFKAKNKNHLKLIQPTATIPEITEHHTITGKQLESTRYFCITFV